MRRPKWDGPEPLERSDQQTQELAALHFAKSIQKGTTLREAYDAGIREGAKRERRALKQMINLRGVIPNWNKDELDRWIASRAKRDRRKK